MRVMRSSCLSIDEEGKRRAGLCLRPCFWVNQIAAPVAAIQPIATPVRSSAPLPAGEVIITPAPQAVIENVVATSVEEIVIADAPRSDDVRSVSGDWVNMRSGPSTNYDVLDTLPRGTQAEVMEVDADGWARIRVTNTGQEGWMAERLLSDS